MKLKKEKTMAGQLSKVIIKMAGNLKITKTPYSLMAMSRTVQQSAPHFMTRSHFSFHLNMMGSFSLWIIVLDI